MIEPQFTTIVRSLQPQLIAQMAAVLESAGIPYQNQGYQHGSLLPLVNFITMELRVPTDRLEEARRAIGDIAELVRDGAAQGHPVFRVSRNNGVVFAIGGGFGGILVAAFLKALVEDLSPWVFPVVLLGAPLFAYLWGARVPKDYCSSPGCPGELAADAIACPRCAGIIRGRISSASEHLEAAEKLVPGDEERAP